MNKPTNALYKAQQIRSWFQPEGNIDLSSICDHFAIEIICKSLIGEGYLVRDKGNKLLFVNRNIRNNGKKRFVIAHELGHYFLHPEEMIQLCKGISEVFNRTDIISRTEYEANQFASELLLPAKFVQAELDNTKITFKKIRDIAEKYGCSITTTVIKCIENSKSEDEILLCYKKNSLQWHATADKDITLKDLPSVAPFGSLVRKHSGNRFLITESRAINGLWGFIEGEASEEIFMIAPELILVIVSGKHFINYYEEEYE